MCIKKIKENYLDYFEFGLLDRLFNHLIAKINVEKHLLNFKVKNPKEI